MFTHKKINDHSPTPLRAHTPPNTGGPLTGEISPAQCHRRVVVWIYPGTCRWRYCLNGLATGDNSYCPEHERAYRQRLLLKSDHRPFWDSVVRLGAREVLSWMDSSWPRGDCHMPCWSLQHGPARNVDACVTRRKEWAIVLSRPVMYNYARRVCDVYFGGWAWVVLIALCMPVDPEEHRQCTPIVNRQLLSYVHKLSWPDVETDQRHLDTLLQWATRVRGPLMAHFLHDLVCLGRDGGSGGKGGSGVFWGPF